MKVFNAYVVQTGEEVCVIARSADHAAEVFVTFWIARTGDAPGEFHVEQGAPGALKDDIYVQTIAEGDAAGVIVRHPDGSTLFDPAIG